MAGAHNTAHAGAVYAVLSTPIDTGAEQLNFGR